MSNDAAFNAGSIISTLDLDRDPFTEGLRIARAQAEDFEMHRMEAQVGVNVDSTGAREQLDAVHREANRVDGDRATTTVDADVSPAAVKIAGMFAKLFEWAHTRSSAEMDVDTVKANTELEALRAHADSAKGDPGAGMAGGGIAGLIAAAVALAPALSPLGASIIGFGGGVAAGMFSLIGGVMLFAKTAAGALEDMQSKLKEVDGDVTKLKGPTRELAEAFTYLQKSQQTLQGDSTFIHALSLGMTVLGNILQQTKPLLDGVSSGISDMLKDIQKATGPGSGFKSFMADMGELAHALLADLGPTLVNFGHAFGSLFEAFSPVAAFLADWLKDMSGNFASWAEGFRKSGIYELFAYIGQYAEPTKHLLSGLFGLIHDLGEGLSPLVGPALDFLNLLIDALREIGTHGLKDVASAIGDLMEAIGPLLPLLADLVNGILGPVAEGFKDIVDNGVRPMVEALGRNLPGVITDITDALNALIGPFLHFKEAGSNWDTTGIIDFAAGILHIVLPALSKLAGIFDDLSPIINEWFTVLYDSAESTLPAIQSFIDKLVGTLLDLWGVVKPYLPELQELIGEILEPLSDIISSDLLPILGDLLDILSPILTDALRVALDFLVGLLESIRSVLDLLSGRDTKDASDKMAKYFGDAFNVLTGKSSKTWEAISKAFGDGFNTILKALADWGQQVVESIQEFFKPADDFAKPMVDAVNHLLSAIGKALGKLAGIVGGAFGVAWDVVVQWWEDLTGSANSHASDVMGAIGAGFSAGWSPISDWFDERVRQIVGFFKGAISLVKAVAGDIINGLWQGFKDAWNAVADWLDARARDIERIFRLATETGSPSKVLARAAKDIMDGLPVGFEESWNTNGAPKLRGIAESIKGFFGKPLLTADTKMAMATEVSVAGQTAQLSALTDEVKRLVDLTRQLPDKTGEAVGSTVGSAFDNTTRTAARLATTTSRKAGL